MKQNRQILIIGSGVVGCALAYTLAKDNRNRILVVERNSSVHGLNQSNRNAGIVHAGIYYPRETEPLKARLCPEGNQLLYQFCSEFDVPHARIGKLVAATNAREEEYLDYIFEIAQNNHVPGVQKISGAEARKLEPAIHATAALYVPSSGVVNITDLLEALRVQAQNHGVEFQFAAPVHTISAGKTFRVNHHHADVVINAAGLYADELARTVNPHSTWEIDPARGELMYFPVSSEFSPRYNLYQAPYGTYRSDGSKAAVSLSEFKRMMQERLVHRTVGVHITPTVERGPQGYKIAKRVVVGPVRSVGYGKKGYRQGRKPSESYYKAVEHFFPDLPINKLKPHAAGIMAVLKGHPDFVIEHDPVYPNFINVLGIDSPGLTSALAIANHVSRILNPK